MITDEYVELVNNLISFKTHNQDQVEIGKCFSYIEEFLKDSRYQCFINSSNGSKSMIISNSDMFKFDCLFCGHIDVVPADDEQFNAKIIGNYLYGRGAIDMKSQVALILLFLKHYNGNKRLGFIISSDEEIGGFNGTPILLDRFNVKAKVAIVPDGGYNFKLINSSRGVLQLNITMKGRSAHSSCEQQGENAILKAVNLYKSIKNELNKQSKNCQTVNLASIEVKNPVYNRVPDLVHLLIDIRYSNFSKIDIVYSILNSHPDVSYEIYAKANPFYMSKDDEMVKKYIKVTGSVLKNKVEIKECMSASDARFFMKYNIPVIIMNPMGRDMHGKNECVFMPSLDQLYEIYNNFVDML